MNPEKELIEKFHDYVGNVEWDILEEFILENSHIWRPIRGHCFETWFDKLMKKLGHKIEPVGGDDTVDRVLNGKTLQLKTPYNNGTKKDVRVSFALHKTHGLEKRPHNLYKPETFADFLIGQHPDGSIIICPKDQIPTNAEFPGRAWPEYLADPVSFEWNTKWKNRFDLLGIKLDKIPDLANEEENKLFPKIGKETDLTDFEIVMTIMQPENFRVLEQNLKGSIRELHFDSACDKRKIKLTDVPKESKTREKIKVDFIAPNGKKIQVKGRTKTLCDGKIIGVEVKGSHGRIPQRLYRKSDFDILAVVLDPGSIPEEVKGIDHNEYNFVLFSSDDLPIHENSHKKMYSWTMNFKTGKTKTLFSNNPEKGNFDEDKTKEWDDEYFKDVFKFDITKVKINDFSILK